MFNLTVHEETSLKELMEMKVKREFVGYHPDWY